MFKEVIVRIRPCSWAGAAGKHKDMLRKTREERSPLNVASSRWFPLSKLKQSLESIQFHTSQGTRDVSEYVFSFLKVVSRVWTEMTSVWYNPEVPDLDM